MYACLPKMLLNLHQSSVCFVTQNLHSFDNHICYTYSSVKMVVLLHAMNWSFTNNYNNCVGIIHTYTVVEVILRWL